MERQFSSYEALFVFDLDLGDEGIKALIEKFKGMIEAAGKVIEVADWGKRRLAYPINDKNEGYYTLLHSRDRGIFLRSLIVCLILPTVLCAQ